MKKPLTAVFDIGKTNKKFFLFDEGFREVYREYHKLPLTRDEDGYPTEDLQALVAWMQETLGNILNSGRYEVGSLNFSSYGASLVHLDREGNVLTPLYNYTKPMPREVEASFYARYGPELEFSRATGTSRAGMLNSGLQLYWLKKKQPEIFGKIRYSLHLPQYLSYVFTGTPVSEFTSIGCHTGLWDYSRQAYHRWVEEEGMANRLPPVVPADTMARVQWGGHDLMVGPGIHDSSAALLPYLESIGKPFVLLSTGTWSIALNPFSGGLLTVADRERDCINYMRTDGQPVLASRLFLGNEFRLQLDELASRYIRPRDYYHHVAFDPECFRSICKAGTAAYRWKSLDSGNCPGKTHWVHDTYEAAYHQLVYELCLLQSSHIRHVIGDTGIKRLYIDGGFSRNEVFIETLSQLLKPLRIRTTDASLGSALGATLAVAWGSIPKGFLKEHYALKKHKSIIRS